MKANARYLVMRFDYVMGSTHGRRIVSVASRHWTLEAALEYARYARRRMCWIVARGVPAHRRATS